MTKTIQFIIIVLFCFSCKIGSTTLSSKRQGSYYYFMGDDRVEVLRTSNIQIETFGNSSIICSIKWISDNSYVARVKELKNIEGCLEVGDSFTVTITKLNRKGYKCVADSKKCGKYYLTVYHSK